jgi:hypothetical protein
MYKIALSGALVILAACTATTRLSTVQPFVTVELAGRPGAELPRTEKTYARSFGNIEFRAQGAGFEPFYGYLPLKFNGGYLALDILFFAPATFYNLRQVYPQYQFDLEKRVVLYRYEDNEEWSTYVPLEVDAADAKKVFAKQDDAHK